MSVNGHYISRISCSIKKSYLIPVKRFVYLDGQLALMSYYLFTAINWLIRHVLFVISRVFRSQDGSDGMVHLRILYLQTAWFTRGHRMVALTSNLT